MLQRGTIVAGYRIDGVVGEGGMGVVYRATQLSLNRVVALKLLSGELSDDPGFRARFQREGQLQAALDHQHIVPVYEAGQTESGLFLAMRLINGPTLKDLIVQGQLNPRRTLRVLAQVAQALDEAHGAGLIHRDVKPQNILIGSGDHAYLADFGLIKAPDDADRLTGTGQFIGTLDYVSPEQVQGDPATGASDIYALAAVLYECLSGDVPFPRPTEAATLQAHIAVPPPRVSDRRPDLPAEIDAVIARGMAKAEGERPRSAFALIRSASHALASASSQARNAAPGRGPENGRSQSTRVGAVMGVPAPPTIAARPAGASPAPATTQAPYTTQGPDTAAATSPTPATAAARATDSLPAPAPDRRRDGSRRRAAYAIVLLLVAAAATAAGYLVGHPGGVTGPAAFTNSAAAGNLQLRYPAGWQLSSSSPSVPGLDFSNRLGLQPGTPTRGLTAGEIAQAGGATLLPSTFRARVTGALPAAERVRFGDLQGFRYRALHVRGLDGPVTLYVAPTSAGVAAIACATAPGDRSGFTATCDQVAATVHLVGATAYPLGPNAAYARTVAAIFTRLNTDVRLPLSILQRAGTPSAQATAAHRLAQIYFSAATSLSRTATSPLDRDAHAAILAALRRVGDGYSRAGAAADSGSTVAYGQAGERIKAGTSALRTALNSLAGSGYKVG